MRKSELVAAIREHRGETNGRAREAASRSRRRQRRRRHRAPSTRLRPSRPSSSPGSAGSGAARLPRSGRARAGEQTARPRPAKDQANEPAEQNRPRPNPPRQNKADSRQGAKADQHKRSGLKAGQQVRQRRLSKTISRAATRTGGGNNDGNNDDDDDGEGRGGRRGRRFRDRRRRERGGEGGGGGGGGDRDTELRDDDVVQPVAGILDVLDNYAFVRTSGYLAGPNDVYVSMNMVRKNGLRRGDADHRRGPGAQGGRGSASEPAAEVQPAGAAGHRQRRPGRGRQEPPRLQQADPAVPEPAAAPRDHAGSADHPRHRPDHADRQGSARPDRVAAQGRQDDDPAEHRQRDHHQQPGMPPDGGARRRAARRGHRHAALGQG